MSATGRLKDPVYRPSTPPDGKEGLKRWLYDEMISVNLAIEAMRSTNATRNAPKWTIDQMSLGTAGNLTSTAVLSVSMLAYADTYSTTDVASFIHKIPHGWKEESLAVIQLDTINANSLSGGVRWGLTYRWLNADEVAPSATTIYVTQDLSGTANKSEVVQFPAIDGASKQISSLFIGGVFRAAGEVSDNATGTMVLAGVGFLSENDSDGSQQQYSK